MVVIVRATEEAAVVVTALMAVVVEGSAAVDMEVAAREPPSNFLTLD